MGLKTVSIHIPLKWEAFFSAQCTIGMVLGLPDAKALRLFGVYGTKVKTLINFN